MSQKPTKSPKKPILLVKTTKVNANKPLLTYSSTTPRKNAKQTASSPVPPIHQSAQKQRQIEMLTVISSAQGIESPRSPRNTTNLRSTSPTSSSQVSPKKDSPDSLRRQIRDQSKFAFQQSSLIKKLHSDLVRAELVTGNTAPNSSPSESPNQYLNLAARLDFLVDNYISQNEKLKKLESNAETHPNVPRIRGIPNIPHNDPAPNDESETIQNINKQHIKDIADKDEKIKQLTDENTQLKETTEKQNNEIQNLNLTLDNKNKENFEEKENYERKLNQQKEELNDLYKQLEEKGFESDPQRRDRELSSRIREVFPNDQDENIPSFVRKDVGLASAIRSIYSSGDDGYITNNVRQLLNAGPGSQDKDSIAEQLRNEVEQKQKEIENQNNQINQLKEELANKDSTAEQLRNEVEQKQNEIENQINQFKEELANKDSTAEQLRNEVEQKQNEIENQNNKHKNEVDELKNTIKSKEVEIDNYVKSDPDSDIIDNYRKEIENIKSRNEQLKVEKEEAEQKYSIERKDRQKAYEDLREQYNKQTEKQKELEDKINELSANSTPNEEVEKLKQELLDSQNKLNSLQQENTQNENIININKSEYEKLQQKLQDFIENTYLTKQQATDATEKIKKLKEKNEELEQQNKDLLNQNEDLEQQNKDLISNSEACLLDMKKQNEEDVKFAKQCREILPGDSDEIKLANAKNNNTNNEPHEGVQKSYYEDFTGIFHPDMTEEEIKKHSENVANKAKEFYNESSATPALNAIFDKASGTELNNIIEQMKQDPNESIRNNAEVLSDALKDDRLSVEAEGMIATTLAMFITQIRNQQ